MDYLQTQLQNILQQNSGPNTTQDSSQFSSSTLVPGNVTTTNTTDTSISNYDQPILYIRSRNVEFDSSSLKPVTRFYPFFGEINISAHVTPKLLEIEMISGVFQKGEIIESDPTFITNKIVFRLCQLNHKTGIYNSPETIFPINPYNQQPLGDTYTASSTILNVDTKALGLPSETDFYGSVAVGMTLIGKSSGAVARVSNIRLISDRNGRLIGSFFIPNASQYGNLKFVNGVNVFSLLDVNSLNLVAQSESFSEANYTSSAVNNVTEKNILTTRNVNVTFPYLVTTVGNKVTVTTTVTDSNGAGATPQQISDLQTRSNRLRSEIDNQSESTTEGKLKKNQIIKEKERIDDRINRATQFRDDSPSRSRPVNQPSSSQSAQRRR